MLFQAPLRLLAGGHLSDVTCAAWHPNATLVVTGGGDRTCGLWDMRAGRCVRLLRGASSSVSCVAVSRDGHSLAAGGEDGGVAVWDLVSGRLGQVTREHSGAVYGLGFSPGDRALVTGGADCSLRTCPSGNSWALDSSTPHTYEECSGAGLCDRVTGECSCFEGYTGFSCQRRASPPPRARTHPLLPRRFTPTPPFPPHLSPGSCPNDCSGNGVCRVLAQVSASVSYSADAWDANRIQACVCDAGYFGSDCSQRRCPTGDDPLTQCADVDPKIGQVQEIVVTLGSALTHDLADAGQGTAVLVDGMALFGEDLSTTSAAVRGWIGEDSNVQLRVGATDQFGSVHYAPTSVKAALAPFPGGVSWAAGDESTDSGAASLKVALENIKNFKVSEVSVGSQFTQPGNPALSNVLQKRFLVTFVPDLASSSNVGVQNSLVCDAGYSCSSSGCSPMVVMPFLYRYAATDAIPDDLEVSSSVTLTYFTGKGGLSGNIGNAADSNFKLALGANQYVRLDSSSSPRLPLGMVPDSDSTLSPATRYDIRVVVAVQAGLSGQVFWTRVTYGNAEIAAESIEYVNGGASGVWSATKFSTPGFQPTLLGMTYQGFIPADLTASIPDAPGVVLSFPSTTVVTTPQAFRFFEILIKLPDCTVNTLPTVDQNGDAISPVNPKVENIECANRGQCNRDTGLCECFSGFYGVACSKQTTMV